MQVDPKVAKTFLNDVKIHPNFMKYTLLKYSCFGIHLARDLHIDIDPLWTVYRTTA